MRSNSRIVLLDVGGTFVKSSLGIAGKGAVEGTFESTPISSDGTAQEIRNSFREAVEVQIRHAEKAGYTVDAVCAALPGPFDYKEGVFMMKHKFAAVYGCSFRDILGDVIDPDIRLAFVHDVNGALLGALAADKSLMQGNIALSTFGTGLGFAYSVDGEVKESESGSPEINIWNLPYNGGILEDFVSRRAILGFFLQQGGVLGEGEDVKEIAQKARMGDEKALKAFKEAGMHYAAGAGALISGLGISRVLFAGQIAKSFDLMEEAIREGLGDDVQLSVLDDIQGTVLIGVSSL